MTNKQPKLCTKKRYAIAFTGILIGVLLGIYREFRDTGTVTGITIVISVVALLVGTTTIIFVGRYANKPEK